MEERRSKGRFRSSAFETIIFSLLFLSFFFCLKDQVKQRGTLSFPPYIYLGHKELSSLTLVEMKLEAYLGKRRAHTVLPVRFLVGYPMTRRSTGARLDGGHDDEYAHLLAEVADN